MPADLSFDQAPPIGVPFRFFLTAPWFGVAAGMLLLWQGGDLLASRWMPGALGLTHLLVLGFMLQAMTGALFQFVPVAAGGNLWRAEAVATIVHPAFAAGAILLCAGFLFPWPRCLEAAAVLMASAGTLFLVTLGRALVTTPAVGATVAGLRGAALALAVTLGLGAVLVTGLVTGRAWPIIEVTHVHAAWGLGGWALLLLAAVAVIVVPMFQMTPPFPPRAARVFPWLVIGCLLLWTGRLVGVATGTTSAGLFALLALAATFCATTLRLQARRRRKVDDANVLMMRSAMGTGLVAVALCAWLAAGLPGSDDNRLQVAAGVLLVAPFVFAINGMLYKIVPFLCWLHLNQPGGSRAQPPNMNRMIPAKAMGRQAGTQLGAFALLLAACLWPGLARMAGVALIVSFAWLAWNLIGAVAIYQGCKRQVPTVGMDSMS
jgi:hypothetical protein